MDNIFIERLWRSIKYEEIHLKAYADGRQVCTAIPQAAVRLGEVAAAIR